MRLSTLVTAATLILLSACAAPGPGSAQTASAPHGYEEPSTGSLFGGQDAGASNLGQNDTAVGQRGSVGAGGGGH